MKYNPEVHHRRSIRLKRYDYAQSGAYFVTICTQGREGLFGEIKNGGMELNEAGKMIQKIWEELPQYHPGFEMDAFIVMPNHIHGIIVLPENVGVGLRAYPYVDMAQQKQKTGQPRRVAPTITLSEVIHHFKSYTTAQYRHRVENDNWPPFPGRLWQRNYYEHIIRDEDSLNKIREYIIQNPVRWEFDMENIAGKPDGAEQNFWKIFGQEGK